MLFLIHWFDGNFCMTYNYLITIFISIIFLSYGSTVSNDKSSELTTVIVLSDNFEGGQFALTNDDNPPYDFETLNGLTLCDLKLGDSISFNGSETYKSCDLFKFFWKFY